MSSQLAVASHALALLAFRGEQGASSELLAKSIGTHAAFVRRVVRRLTDAGLVIGRTGPNGGYKLARSAHEIRLSEVFDAVSDSIGPIPPSSSEPHPQCPIGAGIKDAFAEVSASANESVRSALSTRTVADLSAQAVRRGRGNHRTTRDS